MSSADFLSMGGIAPRSFSLDDVGVTSGNSETSGGFKMQGVFLKIKHEEHTGSKLHESQLLTTMSPSTCPCILSIHMMMSPSQPQ